MHTTPNRPKKVLLMVTKSVMGGAQKYVFDLARSLPSDQFEVTVAAGGNGSLFEKCSAGHIRTLCLPYLDRDISIFKEIKAFFALIKVLRKEKPDVVHLNSPKMGGLGGLAARCAGIKKIVYTNHGWTFHEDRSLLQKTLIKIFSWLIIILSHQTIVLSDKEFNDVKDWSFTKRKMAIIPLGIDVPTFLEKSEARKVLFEKAGFVDQNQKLILSIGELTKNKGYVYAIKALKNYKENYTYMIAGTGEMKEKLDKEIEEKKLDGKVKLLGFVPEAARYMKGVDVFLLPSIKEGLPYVMLEAAFAEVSIIATRVGGIDSPIEPRNPSQLLHALENNDFISFPKLPLDNMVAKTIQVYN